MTQKTQSTKQVNGLEIVVTKHTGTTYSDKFKKTVKLPTKYTATCGNSFSKPSNSQAAAIKDLFKRNKI